MSFLVICFAILGFVFLAVLSVDFVETVIVRVPWILARKFPWRDQEKWTHAVLRKGCKMLTAQKVVPSCDETRYVIWERICNRYTHSCLQGWQYAPLVYGLSKFDVDGTSIGAVSFDRQIQEIDDGFLVYFLNRAGVISDEELSEIGDDFIRIVKGHTSKDGSLIYRQGGRLSFVDGIAFVCPMLARLSAVMRRQDLMDLALTYIRRFSQYGIERSSGLVFHGYDVSSHMPCESLGWGRGSAWYIIGLTLVYEQLCDIAVRNEIRELLLRCAERILLCQQEDGGWCTRLVRGCGYDSSSTAMFSFCFLVLAENGLDEHGRFVSSAKRAIRKLMQSTDPIGRVVHAEGDCHDLGLYSKRYDFSPLAQGMTLLALSTLKSLEMRSTEGGLNDF